MKLAKIIPTVIVSIILILAMPDGQAGKENINEQEVPSAVAVQKEWFQDGGLWQLLGGPAQRITKRRIALADELWIESAQKRVLVHKLSVQQESILSETAINDQGKIDVVVLRLVDGRTCRISGLAAGTNTVTVKYQNGK